MTEDKAPNWKIQRVCRYLECIDLGMEPCLMNRYFLCDYRNEFGLCTRKQISLKLKCPNKNHRYERRQEYLFNVEDYIR